MLIIAVFYCMWIGKKIYQVPTDDGGFDRKEFKQEYIKSMEELDRLIWEKQLPSLGWSIAPIAALGIGTLLAVCGLMGKASNKEVLNDVIIVILLKNRRQ